MKQSHKLAIGVAAALSLGIAAAAAYAQPEQMGAGTGPHMQGGMQYGMQGGMQRGTQGSVQHGMQRGMGHGAMGGGQGAGQQLMTPEERTAFREKMRNAKTPEERQQLAAANHAELQKRAQERGITPHQGHGPRRGATTQQPQSTE